MEKSQIIHFFVNKFIYKNKRVRVLFELQNEKKRNNFIQNLNHKSLDYIDVSNLILIPRTVNVFNFVKENLNLIDDEFCFVISNNAKVDNQIMRFKEVFEQIEFYGFASLLIFISNNKIYLQTEQESGSSERYVGLDYK